MINIVNNNQGKVQIRKKLETDIEPASREQLQNRVHFMPAEFRIPASCERSLYMYCNIAQMAQCHAIALQVEAKIASRNIALIKVSFIDKNLHDQDATINLTAKPE